MRRLWVLKMPNRLSAAMRTNTMTATLSTTALPSNSQLFLKSSLPAEEPPTNGQGKRPSACTASIRKLSLADSPSMNVKGQRLARVDRESRPDLGEGVAYQLDPGVGAALRLSAADVGAEQRHRMGGYLRDQRG